MQYNNVLPANDAANGVKSAVIVQTSCCIVEKCDERLRFQPMVFSRRSAKNNALLHGSNTVNRTPQESDAVS